MTKRLEIGLFRHGEVQFDKWAWSSSSNLRRLVEHYNSQPIINPTKPLSSGKVFDVVVCSKLPRSILSAKTLFQKSDISNQLFNEAELPELPPLPLKLPAIILLVISRAMWRYGADKNCESYAAFRARAKDAARELVELSEANTNVAFVGHAFINLFISHELLQLGFDGPKTPTRKHWAGTVYSLKSA